ncbi:MAG: UrcA family protein [Pseudomonadota bacterium]
MKILNAYTVAVTALGLSLALSVPTQAAPLAGAKLLTRTEVVKYSDLNLATPAGAAILYSRIRTAVHRVCRDIIPTESANSRFERRSCVKDLTDTAVKDVARPTLTALHEGGATSDLTAQR